MVEHYDMLDQSDESYFVFVIIVVFFIFVEFD